MHLNLAVAWVSILIGLVSGTVIGLFFHREGWLGGYDSWRRRMVRLGHIAWLGTGLLNLAFAVTVSLMGWQPAPRLPSVLFVAGSLAMPTVCWLSAWRKPWRHLFFIPVTCLVGATAAVLAEMASAWKGQ